jgi:protoheme ferro-lyase
VYREKAKSMGMVLKRTPSLNFSDRFIKALAAIVEEHISHLSLSLKGRGRG